MTETVDLPTPPLPEAMAMILPIFCSWVSSRSLTVFFVGLRSRTSSMMDILAWGELGSHCLLALLLDRGQEGVRRRHDQLETDQHSLLSGLRIRGFDGSPVPVEELDVLDETEGDDVLVSRRMNDL